MYVLSGAVVLQEYAATPVVPEVTGDAEAVADVVEIVALDVTVTVLVGGQVLDWISTKLRYVEKIDRHTSLLTTCCRY